MAEHEATRYINSISNEPRRQLLSFHLAHYYFLKDDFANAIEYFEKAGYDNLDNDQIADAKFEKAYAHFNLKQFAQAKPLFNEKNLCKCNPACISKHYSKEITFANDIAYVNKRISPYLPVKRLIKEKSFFTVLWIIYRWSCPIFTR